MASKFADGGNGPLATTMALDEHFSIENRPLLVVDPSNISPMPLHLTLGITGGLLRLGIEAVYFHHGQARARAYAVDLALGLPFVVGVAPRPYFGGAFEGRQCQLIARRLSAVVELLATYVPAADAAAYGAACGTWAELLPVLTWTGDSSTEDAKSFRAGTARFVDGLCAAFPWFSATPQLHTLCCHAPDFLDYFGSLGRYSEQGLESWNGHFNKNAAQHPADSFLESCLSYVKRSAVRRALGNAAYHRGAKRYPGKAGPGTRDAKTPLDKRTYTGKALTGASGASASCVLKQGEERCKWANDNLAAAAKKIDAHWRRAKQSPSRKHVPVDDEAWDEDGDYGELIETETACLLALLEE